MLNFTDTQNFRFYTKLKQCIKVLNAKKIEQRSEKNTDTTSSWNHCSWFILCTNNTSVTRCRMFLRDQHVCELHAL